MWPHPSFPPPSPQNFPDHFQSTPSTFSWCHFCHNSSHPAEACPSIGYSLGLGHNQFNAPLQGPTSESYPSNLECWNDLKFLWNQPSQNLQSNWSNSDPSPPSVDLSYNFEDTQKLVDEVHQGTLECRALLDEYFKLIGTPSQTSHEPLESISKQTQESHNFHQVNQIFMPQDSTPHFDKFFESVHPSFQLNQFDEFESDNLVEKE